MDWKECWKKKIVKQIQKDFELANSLVNLSEDKLEVEENISLNKKTFSSKISLAYDSLRESLEALAVKNGYKIYNHECYTAFLKEVLGETSKGDEFDSLRKIRNSVNYYAKQISLEDSRNVIERIKELRNFVVKLLNK